jgi:ABC-2 type transport system ATP-binding protein
VIDLTSAASSAPIISALVNAGAEVEEVRKEKASLEDVFLELMEEEDR